MIMAAIGQVLPFSREDEVKYKFRARAREVARRWAIMVENAGVTQTWRLGDDGKRLILSNTELAT